jgi:hypothetical protein
VGEYTGRRRGRPAPEAAYQAPETPEYVDSHSQPDYFADDPYHAEESPPDDYYYPVAETAYGESQYPDSYYAEPERSTYEEPEYDPYAQSQYIEPQYIEPQYGEPQYAESQDGESQYAEPQTQEPQYAEPRLDPIRRRARERADVPEPREAPERSPAYRRPPRSGRVSSTLPPNHLPYLGAAAVALIAAPFVRPGAVAAVVALTQAATAWAVLDLLGLPSRRAAAVAFAPALAADAATFGFQPDVSGTGVLAGLGCGFVLAAADAVLRARRHGVEPGASKQLAATVAAMLFACLGGLFVAAARIDSTTAAFGGALAGLLAYAASRNRELTRSRTAVVGLGCTGAALVTYAAAILVT